MKLFKVLFCVLILAATLVAAGKYYPILQAKWEREKRLAAAEATYQRQIYLLKERQEKSSTVPQINNSGGVDAETQARWEAAKERGKLPDQRASVGSTTVNSPQYVPNRR